MTSKRILKEQIKAESEERMRLIAHLGKAHGVNAEIAGQVGTLEGKLDVANAAAEAANEHANLHATNEETLLAFLDDLLILEPSLQRFQLPDSTDWDFAGALVAAHHVVARDLALELAA